MPNRRSAFVSLSQKRSSGGEPSGPSSAAISSGPRNGCSVSIRASSDARSSGAVAPTYHAHVFRYHAVGSTWIVSSSGPALVTWTVSRTSNGSAFA